MLSDELKERGFAREDQWYIRAMEVFTSKGSKRGSVSGGKDVK